MSFIALLQLGAKALEKASDTFSLQGFNSFVKMYMSNKLLEKQVGQQPAPQSSCIAFAEDAEAH